MIPKLANQMYFPEWISRKLTAVCISLSVSLHTLVQCTQTNHLRGAGLSKTDIENFYIHFFHVGRWSCSSRTTRLLLGSVFQRQGDFTGRGGNMDGKLEGTCEAQTAGSCQTSHTECWSKSLCRKTNNRRGKQSHLGSVPVNPVLTAVFNVTAVLTLLSLSKCSLNFDWTQDPPHFVMPNSCTRWLFCRLHLRKSHEMWYHVTKDPLWCQSREHHKRCEAVTNSEKR